MSNVALSIGGRGFTVACAAGEEEHIADLGRMIDAKLSTMGDLSGQSESRMLLFAALFMADELHDAQSAPAATGSFLSEASGERLDAIAVRLENLATHLEG
jgi:cell division protein ZapA